MLRCKIPSAIEHFTTYVYELHGESDVGKLYGIQVTNTEGCYTSRLSSGLLVVVLRATKYVKRLISIEIYVW